MRLWIKVLEESSHPLLLTEKCKIATIYSLKKNVWLKKISEKKCGMVKIFLVEKFYSFLIVFFQATVIKSLYTPAEHFKYLMDRGTEKREEHVSLFLKKFP